MAGYKRGYEVNTNRRWVGIAEMCVFTLVTHFRRTDRWTDGRINRRMDVWTDGRILFKSLGRNKSVAHAKQDINSKKKLWLVKDVRNGNFRKMY